MPHIHQDIDFVVTAFIVHQGKVLLIDHKALKMWLPVGGHIELNENPDEALLREIREECGLEVEIVAEKPPLPPGGEVSLYQPAFVNMHPITPTHRHVNLTYLAKAKSDAIVLNADEHDDIRWFSAADLDDPSLRIKPGVRYYALEALKRLA